MQARASNGVGRSDSVERNFAHNERSGAKRQGAVHRVQQRRRLAIAKGGRPFTQNGMGTYDKSSFPLSVNFI